MQVYRLDTGGAVYWFAAKNLRGAVDAAFRCWEQEGSLSDVEDFEIELMHPERAKGVMISCEDDTDRSAWDLAQECTEAEVLGCSEWP